jgi:hypothetical protein
MSPSTRSLCLVLVVILALLAFISAAITFVLPVTLAEALAEVAGQPAPSNLHGKLLSYLKGRTLSYAILLLGPSICAFLLSLTIFVRLRDGRHLAKQPER